MGVKAICHPPHALLPLMLPAILLWKYLQKSIGPQTASWINTNPLFIKKHNGVNYSTVLFPSGTAEHLPHRPRQVGMMAAPLLA